MFTDSQAGQEASPPRIVALTGFMGAGKTSIGHALAVLLRWSFVDLDREIELRQGKSVREIFQFHGESQFREIETAALREMLEQTSAPTVIALGGGTFIRAGNADLLRNFGALVVFLDTPIEQMLQRCLSGPESSEESEENVRPLAADSVAFRALYAQRLPHYRNADLSVSTADKTTEENARKIASRLGLAANPY